MTKEQPAYPHNPAKDCDMCFGRGTITKNTEHDDGTWTQATPKCSTCNGTGKK